MRTCESSGAPKKAQKFLEGLQAQEVRLVQGRSLLTNLLLRGEVAGLVNSFLQNAIEAERKGSLLEISGVLDAFPKLRFCFMEGGGTEVPHLMEGLAAVYSEEGDYSRLKSKPLVARAEGQTIASLIALRRVV
jgi:hypothetical protein